jgi:hypothetical protein
MIPSSGMRARPPWNGVRPQRWHRTNNESSVIFGESSFQDDGVHHHWEKSQR